MAKRRSEWSLFTNLNPREADGLIALLTLIFIVLGVLGAAAMIIPHRSPSQLFATDFFTKRRAQQVITSMLVDPDSAQFRNVTAVSSAGGDTLVCGEVNSRNRLGGFGGFKRFVVSQSIGQAVIAAESPPTEKQMYSDQINCERAESEEDKSLYCDRSKRSTAEYQTDKLYRELSRACPLAWTQS